MSRRPSSHRPLSPGNVAHSHLADSLPATLPRSGGRRTLSSNRRAVDTGASASTQSVRNTVPPRRAFPEAVRYTWRSVRVSVARACGLPDSTGTRAASSHNELRAL